MTIGLTIPVIAGLIAGSALVAIFAIYGNNGDNAAAPSTLTTTLYLFKHSPDASNEPATAYYGALYLRVRDMVGGLDPLTFEQSHYTIGKDGVFNYTGKRIDGYGNVSVVVSDSIMKPDGSVLRAEEISPKARFYYSALWSAALIVEDSGDIMVWNTITYDNPNRVGEDGIVRVVALPVEIQDVHKIESNYQKLKELMESYRLTEEDIEIFEREYPGIDVVRGESS